MLNPTPQHTVLFTVDDLEKMIDAGVFAHRTGRIELIEGEFRQMSPASDHHDDLIRVLTMWSVRQQTEEKFEIAVQMGIRLQKTESMPEPDLYWIQSGRHGRATMQVVPLIIEVSVSSIQYDRKTKGRLYALDGLQEYWIVDCDQQLIEVHSQPAGEQFTKTEVFGRGDTLVPQCLPTAKLDIGWLFDSAGF